MKHIGNSINKEKIKYAIIVHVGRFSWEFPVLFVYTDNKEYIFEIFTYDIETWKIMANGFKGKTIEQVTYEVCDNLYLLQETELGKITIIPHGNERNER